MAQLYQRKRPEHLQHNGVRLMESVRFVSGLGRRMQCTQRLCVLLSPATAVKGQGRKLLWALGQRPKALCGSICAKVRRQLKGLCGERQRRIIAVCQ